MKNIHETKFSIIMYFDPKGDGKSARKRLRRTNFHSYKSLIEVYKTIETYNKKVDHYQKISIHQPDHSKKFKNFDKHYYSQD